MQPCGSCVDGWTNIKVSYGMRFLKPGLFLPFLSSTTHLCVSQCKPCQWCHLALIWEQQQQPNVTSVLRNKHTTKVTNLMGYCNYLLWPRGAFRTGLKLCIWIHLLNSGSQMQEEAGRISNVILPASLTLHSFWVDSPIQLYKQGYKQSILPQQLVNMPTLPNWGVTQVKV